ncbi:hypothetical protein ScPMuIL_010445 [Solemya velum]
MKLMTPLLLTMALVIVSGQFVTLYEKCFKKQMSCIKKCMSRGGGTKIKCISKCAIAFRKCTDDIDKT